MTVGNTRGETHTIRWQDHKSLVLAWLLLFFPVGLYGLWSGSAFEKSRKWQVTGAVVAVVIIASAGVINLLIAFVGAPLAVYLLWRDQSIARKTFRNFAIAAGVIALLALTMQGSGGGGFGDGSCSQVQSDGSYTYYRDADCNVIGRSG